MLCTMPTCPKGTCPEHPVLDDICMQGWQTRDRRKPHIIKADEEADALAAQLTDADTDGELPISCKHLLSLYGSPPSRQSMVC
jgi:hypothetical protein